ncbi:neocarzinostatin apoprotein domain-containing protein [Streptomyces sp. NPDC048479]|uniref:neocarzinostatin apoprotein domain-containing protein n=1 Tax=Streptomyces sp. NPDC048479 TaxID=3154725 RepID=UPI00342292BE
MTAIGRTAKARAAALGAGLGCGALLLSLMGAQPGWAEPAPAGPALTVDRTTGLLDGDIVNFRITGGPPKQYVWVKECGPSASVTTCDDDTRRQFRVLPDGTYDVSPKKLYARLSTESGDVDCRTVARTNPCSLALTDNAGALLTTVPMSFRPHGPLEAAPTLWADPNRDLLHGQVVHVTGRGYEPQYHVSVLECVTGSTSTFGCRPGSRPPGTTDEGRMDREIAVSVSFTSIDGRTVDCRPRNSCELVAFASRVRGPETVRARLHFDPAQPLP